MNYEEEDEAWELLEYKGARVTCKFCLHCPRIRKDDVTKYTPCKMIDHNRFRFYKQIFNGYQGAIDTKNICCHYEPAKWDVSGQREWKGLEAYIEFLDKGYYFTPSFLGYNKIRDTTTGGVTICIGGFDTYGEIHYLIALYDWITGEWFKDNKIKYVRKSLVLRTPSGKTNKTKHICGKGVDDMTEFLETDNCDYLKEV